MLGILRYLLAVMVVLSHLWYDPMWWQGAYAVFCFYLISGYLMCLVINETYTGPGGIGRYALNRILRIYPIYLLVLGLSILVTIGFQSVLEQPLGNGLTFGKVMPLPESFGDWVANVTLLYLPSGNTFNVSPAWSLRVELFFYAAMLVLTRRVWLVVVWVGASMLYALWLEHQGVFFIDRYTSVFGASIAFSLGASVYYLRQFVRIPDWNIPIATTAYFLHLWFAPDIWGFARNYPTVRWFFESSTFGLYGNVMLGAYLLFAIVSSDRTRPVTHRIGAIAGNLAYPIFLLHWIAGTIILQTGVSFDEKSVYIPVALLTVNAMAFLAYRWVELPINRGLRARIRGNRGQMAVARGTK